jgi:hypothetical protein
MKLSQRARTRTRQTARRILVAATGFSFFLAFMLIAVINVTDYRYARAASAGDYRSKTSGSWATASNWEKYNGTTWSTAATAPVSTDGVIEILSGHTMTVSANVTVDQVLVDAGGTLTVSANTLTIANGAGNDIDISGAMNLTGGTLTISASAIVNVSTGGIYTQSGGTETTTAGWAINNGGTYVHNVDGKNIPVATWGASSTLKITGVVASNLVGTYQDFGNVIYNCTGQTCCTGFGTGSTIEMYDNLKSIAGDFTVQSTGSGGMWLFRSAGSATVSGNYIHSGGTIFMSKGVACTLNVNGNFTITGGTFCQAERYAMPVLNVYGNMYLTGGTFNHSSYQSLVITEGVGTVNLYGNYIRTAASHTETATLTGHGEFNFTKAGTQTFTYTGGSITNTVNFTVASGSILDLSTYAVTGGGTFTVSSGGGLILGSTAGITSTGATGNVQVTGTRSYNTGADYTYNATSAQVTGNGLPATVHNITFDNASGVTLTGSTSATNIVTLTRGLVTTGINELGTTNTSTSAVTGYSSTSYINGFLRRSVSASGSYDFPVGNSSNYEFGNLNLSSITGFTSILGSFSRGNPIDEILYPLIGVFVNGTPIEDMLNYGYWTFTPNSLMLGGSYSVTLKEIGYSNPASTPLSYAVIKRSSVISSWVSLGTHTNSTQSEVSGTVTAVRSNLTSFSDFGIGKGNGSLPITLISFDAKPSGDKVKFTWVTGNEINNDYFTIERSKDGRAFEPLFKKDGAGNSTATLHYSAMDENPIAGMNYYRLKQTDYDGKFTYSEIEKVKFEKGLGEDALKVESIGPNPFHESFNVNYSSEEEGAANVMLMNANGSIIRKEVIQTEKGLNSYEFIDNMGLQTGVYYITINVNDKAVTKKIIKN